jgi:glucose/arabinose dehydrogenase
VIRSSLLIWLLAGWIGLPAAAPSQELDDPSLTVEVVVDGGLSAPTTMAFVAPDDILVLEKDTANVRRVLDGEVVPEPVLTLPANTYDERGALGIAVDTASPPHVFIYFTEAAAYGEPAIANRVYRYDWNPGSGTLENPLLVLDLPVLPGTNHNGGFILLGPPGEAPGVGDGSLLYAAIGDLNRAGQLQNKPAGAPPDDTSVILRVRQDGTPAPGNPFTPRCSVTTTTRCDDDGDCPEGETCRTAVARYYAYGVRNSFGLAIDPVTRSLWDTENGVFDYDEINRVNPGMNSGWIPLMGPDARSPAGTGDLFRMPGRPPTYSDPEFSWLYTLGVTSIVFPHGSSLGAAYDDVAIVGEVNLGQLYALPLNRGRTGFDLDGIPGLADLVADDHTERDALRFGTGFWATDIEMGPDGHLYVVRIGPGAILRIRGPGPAPVPAFPIWSAALLVLALGGGGVLAARAGSQRGSKA